jgi:outer membrane immunogenic protein
LQWAAHTETVSKKLDWFSTIRARAGFAIDRVLIFATGGFAIADVRSDLDYLNDFGSHRVGSASKTRFGWVGGGGVEYGLTGNWSMKLEYLYLDFGKFSYSSPNIGTPSANAPNDSWGTDVRAREHILRVGVNYRLSDPSVVAKY